MVLCISKLLLLIHIRVNVLTRRRVCHPVLTTLFSSFFPVNSHTQRSPFWVVVPGTASLHFPHVFVDHLNLDCEPNCKDFWNKSFPCLNINEFRKQFFPRPKPRHEMVTILQRTEEPSINNQMESDQAWRRILQRVLSSLGPGIASPATRVIAKRLVHTNS